ncbi:glycosyltransferase [Mucilaginibacter sp.]|jgi:glycosyltransferase involved in cell wall biosynthesis|uniref:glycosyltransferase n=1 Tax=Mucilaginibacter sp. TaxID=1882438 RepID=UPI002CB2BCC4|nr:glycosyltransferase [Mucilaginibacter sp.]HTI60215.1 glycosyltransferase [Mucilaginibacter sp.]
MQNAAKGTNRPTICLNMIVKNESKVIQRCLGSLKNIIDYWVIVDTGSSDGTQELIRSFMSDVPGELHERPWINFGHNRSEALTLARGKGDYIFIIDADEIVALDPGFEWRGLTGDSYLIKFLDNGITYRRCQLVNNRLNWRYEGVLHEYIYCDEAATPGLYEGISVVRFLDGARSSDPNKFKRDALVLEQGLLDEPGNLRYLFYLAQSYKDANDIDQAIKYYTKRAEKGGWDQEVWYSLYQVAQLMERRGDNWANILEAYLKAYQYYPKRVGPLFGIIRHYMYVTGEFQLAYIFAKKAVTIPEPDDILFVENDLYNWFVPLEFAVCSYWVGDQASAVSTNNKLLQKKGISAELFVRVIENRKFSLNAMYKKRERPLSLRHTIKVVVVCHNPGHFLDNCIERLMQQTYTDTEYIFIDNGSTDGSIAKISGQTGMKTIREDLHCAIDQLIARHLPGLIGPDDLVYLMRGQDWLASDSVLTEINEEYSNRYCQLLYSQFRKENGQYGTSMPLVPAIEAKRVQLQESYPVSLSLKGSLLLSYCSSVKGTRKVAEGNAGKDFLLPFAYSLMELAGFENIQFDDKVWLIKNCDQ